tara:strand:- start:412 stop:585 length:174 start_codon:yes stop_codon:yes gene_type:complete
MDYTLGEIVIETFSNNANILTQGFHQEDLKITTAVVNLDIKTKLYPKFRKQLNYIKR